MHREHLLGQLDPYAARFPGERDCVTRFGAFVRAHADCFLRSCVPGHITASAWILSPDRGRFLLTHHRKLGRWLQLGGHADGEPRPHRVALREAQEESGLRVLRFLVPEPIDFDIHAIPARGSEPEHLHYDVRFVLIAAPGQELAVSDESHELRWFPMRELEAHCSEESVLRIGRKVRALPG
jgi:8-oxo-dGTP pyrophosphatase MutT (NUDIX family)